MKQDRWRNQWDFKDSEWKHAAWTSSQRGRCNDCLRQRQDLRWCSGCQQRLPQAMHFSAWMWRHVKDEKRKCNACSRAASATEVETRYCNGCEKEFSQTYFSDQQWQRVGRTKRKCMQCCVNPNSPHVRGTWYCPGCKNRWEKDLFRLWQEKRPTARPNGSQRCNQCYAANQAKEKRQTAETIQKHVQKRTGSRS